MSCIEYVICVLPHFTPLNLHPQLARALVEHETLNSEEVQKVIKGEPIGNISEVLDEDISNLGSESS